MVYRTLPELYNWWQTANTMRIVTVENLKYILYQGYTKLERQISRTITFCTVAPNICESSVMEVVEFDPISAKNFEFLSRYFLKFCAPLVR